ncbi:MAG: coproporphyrinogen dehydrogenase HemZ [Clostridia bacterium]|nr:coproporphyrinogen dehydrogenase HemZ [Clostridia bacterium]
MAENSIVFYFPENEMPFHFFEALQIFNNVCEMPKLCANAEEYRIDLIDSSGNVIRSEKITAEIAACIAGGEGKNISDTNLLKRYLYKIMSSYTGYSSPWGCMTGVRPAKIVNVLKKQGLDNDGILRHFGSFYLMDEKKARLAVNTADIQEKFLEEQRIHPENIGFYIGIPFCPTRCLYCSFASNPISTYKKSIDTYLDLMEQELIATVEIVKNSGCKVESLYLGGGTPTSLDEKQFARYMKMITDNFDVSSLREFALEAGRPDSITEEKLKEAKSAGVNRISVNPQTMNDATLKRIGRRHSSYDTEKAFYLTKKAGFANINTDIIAGLPGETYEDFIYTLEKIKEFNPDSLTVHTLSIKRAAELRLDMENRKLLHGDEVGQMVAAASVLAENLGMHPFYMYRQKNMLGNHENVCYCRPGCESPYNIHIMEEDQSIVAVGAAGVSKRVAADGSSIKRAFNVKGVEDYMLRMPEMIERKRELFL